MIYDVDYFINKFESIPEDEWYEGAYQYNEKHCALGHCGAASDDHPTKEAVALKMLFGNKHYVIQTINDGGHEQYNQPTPKQRILAALYDIKKMQSKDIESVEKRERIVYVSVPVTITEQAKELVMS